MSMPTLRRIFRTLVYPLLSITIFVQGSIVIWIFQYIVEFIYRKNPIKLKKWIDATETAFISLLMSILTIVSPSNVRITTENKSIPPNTFAIDKKKGRIVSSLSKRSIMIANHQIYTDWVFLWWITYTSNIAGNVCIMLKESLSKLPILGTGMRKFEFIFLKRKWDEDKLTISKGLKTLNDNSKGKGSIYNKTMQINPNDKDANIHWPYCLILFPEGTNLSSNTRRKSDLYCDKIKMKHLECCLLPHSTGLYHSLLSLQSSLDVLYDVAIGYSGLKKEEYGELVYRIKNFFIEGKPPKLVDIHFRAFKINEIPLENQDVFSDWLFKVWYEKDRMLDRYYETGTFVENPKDCHVVEDGFKISFIEILIALLMPVIGVICSIFFFRWIYHLLF